MNVKSSLIASAFVSSALGGLIAGCADPKPAETPDAATGAADAASSSGPKACCKGLNECKAKGDCRVAGKQDCKGMNECRGQGGCNKRCKK